VPRSRFNLRGSGGEERKRKKEEGKRGEIPESEFLELLARGHEPNTYKPPLITNADCGTEGKKGKRKKKGEKEKQPAIVRKWF